MGLETLATRFRAPWAAGSEFPTHMLATGFPSAAACGYGHEPKQAVPYGGWESCRMFQVSG